MKSIKTDFDVAVIGGGPAGSALAAYLAKADVSCVVLEKSVFPRPHVGESLVPASTRVFKELGFLEKMEDYQFPHKYGAVWTSSDRLNQYYDVDWDGLNDDCHADIRFSEREQEGVSQNYTYHVDRGKFDLLLLEHAQEFGAAVHQGVAVKAVDLKETGPVTVHTESNGQSQSIKAKLLVDASGRQTFLGNKLKIKVRDSVFDQYAIHTWFDGYDRGDSEIADYIHIHFLSMTNTWVWQIPITDSITSFGVVTQKKNFAKSKQDREDFFWECIDTRKDLRDGLRKAEQIRPLSDEGDYSYAMKQICGNRWLLVGDAARFVDPIFSSGVSIALNSARLASFDIISAVEKDNFTRDSFLNYESTMKRGTKNWYDFISVYYRLNVLFTVFIRHPAYRIEILKLLQGDVYDEEQPAVLQKMNEIVNQVEANPRHVWHKLLGDLTNNSFNPTK